MDLHLFKGCCRTPQNPDGPIGADDLEVGGTACRTSAVSVLRVFRSDSSRYSRAPRQRRLRHWFAGSQRLPGRTRLDQALAIQAQLVSVVVVDLDRQAIDRTRGRAARDGGHALERPANACNPWEGPLLE